MDDQGCPRCKTTKYRNPSLKLMVNVCGHTLCESCVELLFVRGAGNCQECDTPLRKSNFRVQLFEDPAVDKEVEIRKKVLKIYNKREDDFPSLNEYNDFLEEIEEIVFNLTNNVDLENTKKKMELYQKDNKEVIQKNKIKLYKNTHCYQFLKENVYPECDITRFCVCIPVALRTCFQISRGEILTPLKSVAKLPAISLALGFHRRRLESEKCLFEPLPFKGKETSLGVHL
uniref:CDK-activating kinase assembly factor MAT1 n=1 Tax=Strix occidentalis caurina TaxID=311401 RepID=A0A8D0KR22_STROC